MSVAVAVVDFWALLAFLRGEGQAGRSMRRYLRRARGGNLRLLLNLINLGEVYYRIAQIGGQEKAGEALELIERRRGRAPAGPTRLTSHTPSDMRQCRMR